MGLGGSKIIVTTRSELTARSIGNNYVNRLGGLSQEDSQWLFGISAFGESEKNRELVEIGDKIVGKCHRNPLAIKVIGSLLYGQDLCKWESIAKSGLGANCEGSDKILPILKISYHNLAPSLKSCCSYCAIFPKDFRMDKDTLISLWIAQGYIVLLDGVQSVEEVAEEYFLILMRRCFFQDVEKDNYDNIKSVKIHDLMHDVAQEVGKEEICVVTCGESNLGEKACHVNIVNGRSVKKFLCSRKIRSYICSYREESLMNKQVENFTSLRVLELSYLGIDKSLPCFIDSLLLLRYLNLCNSYLEEIPNSITRLYNLETLILKFFSLRELPKDFSRLVNLRHLDVSECKKLSKMPKGMDKLTKLKVLPYFVAGGRSDNELKELQVLTEIKGHMHISVRNNYSNVDGINDEGEGYLKNMKHLTELTVEFEWEGECGNLEVVLKNLEPPLNLKGLSLLRYKGTTIPWSAFSSQHHLVDIVIVNCHNLERIPALSKLPHLKSLKLLGLDSVEYMEDEISSCSNDAKAVVVAKLFPSLEYLKIRILEKLKGWWKGKLPEMGLRFSRLLILQIQECPNLVSFAPCSSPQYLNLNLRTLLLSDCPSLALNLNCPTVKKLYLIRLGESSLITCTDSQDEAVKLRYVNIDKVGYLNSLPTNCLTRLKVNMNEEVESVLEIVEAIQRCVSSLRSLCMCNCKNLSSLSGLEHFTALEELTLCYRSKLSIREEDEEPWKSLQTIRILEFDSITGMKSLPQGMQHLTSLQFLLLHSCKNMEGALPEWMCCLSSLQSLEINDCPGIRLLPEALKDLTSLKKLIIYRCPDLTERCKEPNGEDLPKIQHIPNISILP